MRSIEGLDAIEGNKRTWIEEQKSTNHLNWKYEIQRVPGRAH